MKIFEDRIAEKNSRDYLDDLLGSDDEFEDTDLLGRSEIVEFLKGQNVLLTGASGFVGKLLIDKLIRTCPKIGKLYMIMRPKKGKTPEQRFQELFEDPLYIRMKKEIPNFMDHMVMIEGDTSLDDLGLTSASRELLVENVHIVYHCAATVRFDEKIKHACNINVRGSKLMLLLAKDIKHLKSFVYVSTAFSNCIRNHIEEKYYDPPQKAEKILSLMELLDDDFLTDITPKLLGTWPNTYAFSKALAEDIVKIHGRDIPCCIVRPSIMIATYKEPVSGWINNLYGPTGVVVGAGLGLLRSLHCHQEKIADIIPADYVINEIIVASWDTAKNWHENLKKAQDMPVMIEEETPATGVEPPIYNSVSSCQKPISWGTFMKLNELYGVDVPSERTIWVYVFMLNRHLFIHNIAIFFLHIVPAVIVDNLAKVVGREPILLKAYQKIHKFSGVISYFSTQQWSFDNSNTLRLWERTAKIDQKIFDFNLDSLSWHDFFFVHIRGLRVFMIKDSLDTIPQGRAKMKKLYAAHYTILTVLSLLLLWLAYGTFMLMYNWAC